MMSSKKIQNKGIFILCLVFVFFFNNQSIAQSIDPPLMEWIWPDDQMYQTDIVATSMDQTIDGGYVIAGHKYDSTDYDMDLELIKVNSNGIVQWDKVYNTIEFEYLSAVSQTDDGGYILAGRKCITYKCYSEDAVIYLVKVSANGGMQWESKVSGNLGDWWDEYNITDVFQVDGGYIIGGSKYFSGTQTTDSQFSMFLLKADSLGQFLWEKEIGDPDSFNDYAAHSVVETEAGGFALAGENYLSPEIDACLILTDAQGNEIERRLYGEQDVAEIFYSIDRTSDGGFILGGIKFPRQGVFDPLPSFVLKLDSSFIEEWYKEIPEIDPYGGSITTVKQTHDGEYIVGRSFGDTHHVMKLNKSGEEKWYRSFDIGSEISSIQQTEDLGYIMLGNINWAGKTKSRLVKVEADEKSPLEILDPNPDLIDANGDLLTGLNNTDKDNLAQLGVARNGAATDGVTKLLLRFRTTTKDPVEFSILPSLVNLTKLDGTEITSGVTVDPIDTNYGSYAFAVYQVPDRLPDNPSDVDVEFSVSQIASSQTWKSSIRLYPPPVVLVHGTWSKSSVWNKPNGGLKGYLKGLGFRVFSSDYGSLLPAGSFDPLAKTGVGRYSVANLIMTTNVARNSVRSEGIAVTQVDVVAHSLGGLMARSRVASQWNKYNRPDNFNEGDFNKIITIGTPHAGTPFADWLVENKCDKLVLGIGYTLEEWFSRIKRPIGTAIYEMQTSSYALENLGETNVPSHTIRCVEPSFSLTKEYLNYLIVLSGNMATPIDVILGGVGNHDVIVPVASQKGSLDISLPPPFSNIIHADLSVIGTDIGETESQTVWDKVVYLLLESPKPPTFGSFNPFHRTGDPTDPYPCSTFTPFNSSHDIKAMSTEDLSAATITLSPAPGSLVHPGELLNIELSIANENPVEGVLFITGDRVHLIEGAGPFAFSYEVPKDRCGEINIYADTFGPGPENYSTSTWVSVQPDSDLSSLEAFPSKIPYDQVGQLFQIQVKGYFADGTSMDLTDSGAGTSYSTLSGNDNVISVSPDGLVESQGTGEDTVLISNSGQLTQVTVNVTITNLPPVLDPLTDVTMIEGGTLDLALTATDPDGDEIELSGFNLPAFVTVFDFGGGSGQLQLRPSTADIGTFSFGIVATDNGSPPYGDVSSIRLHVLSNDLDGDGFPDNEDSCPNSDLSPKVVIEDCDSGVENYLLFDGCSILDLIADCADGVCNHGAFMRCVEKFTNDLKCDGIISGEEKGKINSCAATAEIP